MPRFKNHAVSGPVGGAAEEENHQHWHKHSVSNILHTPSSGRIALRFATAFAKQRVECIGYAGSIA
jgi:hypothetical protein